MKTTKVTVLFVLVLWLSPVVSLIGQTVNHGFGGAVSDLDRTLRFEELVFGATHSEVLAAGLVLSEAWTSPDHRMQGFKYEGFKFGGVRDDIPLHAWFFDDLLFAVSIGPAPDAAMEDFANYRERFLAETAARETRTDGNIQVLETTLFRYVRSARTLIILCKPVADRYDVWFSRFTGRQILENRFPDLMLRWPARQELSFGK